MRWKMNRKIIKRGQVWFYKPTVSPSGHIQKGPRPVIIVSNDHMNKSSAVVLAVPCTTQLKRNFPTHVLFIMDKIVNVALTEQAGPVNVDELVNLKYTLEGYILEQIDLALKISFGLSELPDNGPVCKNEEGKEFEAVRNNRWTDERITSFLRAFNCGEPVEKIAARYNLTPATASKYYRKFMLANEDDDYGIVSDET